MHYPGTALAALVGLVAIVAAVVLFSTGSDAQQRVGILVALVGPIITTILTTNRGEAAAHAARRADARVAAAVEQTAPSTQAILDGTAALLGATQQVHAAVTRAEQVVNAANGGSHAHTPPAAPPAAAPAP